jgi:hypothetical protein
MLSSLQLVSIHASVRVDVHESVGLEKFSSTVAAAGSVELLSSLW